ncbi:hypothetical protein PINS_up003386 [Pythium insidiosum]|nr:hypothetical protein PINS_up003386 [Pythium insidiosum]
MTSRLTWLLSTLVLALLVAAQVQALDTTLPDKITLTSADGQEREVTREEFEAMSKRQAQLQDEIKANAKEGEWVKNARLEDIERKDPMLAVQIRLAAFSFQELQRHGYAQGYALSSFSEKTNAVISSREEQRKGEKREYRIEMELRARVDKRSGVEPNPGTRAKRQDRVPQELVYDVELLLDRKEQASVVSAWELRTDGRRGPQLSIKPSEALLTRHAERKRRQQEESISGRYSSYVLVVGVAMLVIGVAVLLVAPRPRHHQSRRLPGGREQGEAWELANKNK